MKARLQKQIEGLATAVDSIVLDPVNSKIHSERNLQIIANSLERFGQTKPVILDKEGICRAGNGLVMAAKSIGWTHVAAIKTLISKEEAIAYGIVDNKASEIGVEWNEKVLVARLKDVDSDLRSLLGFSSDEWKELEPEPIEALDLDDDETLGGGISGDECTCPHCGFKFIED